LSKLTVADSILVHLSRHSRYNDKHVCPPEVTQEGISRGIGKRRAHVCLELQKLVKRKHVESRVAHIKDQGRRKTVYFVTPAGEEIARELRERAGAVQIGILRGEVGPTPSA